MPCHAPGAFEFFSKPFTLKGEVHVMAASKTWRRLKGENQLPKVVQGVAFRNGAEVADTPAQDAA